MTTSRASCTLYVDPVCPYAWIASRWLNEVARLRPVDVELRPMSIAVLNERRDLDPWYRDFNNRSWLPARVAAATQASAAFPRFYEAFGRRVHLEGCADWGQVVVEAVEECGLPHSFVHDALNNPETLATLRERQKSLADTVGIDTGAPTLIVDGTAYFGPVLRAVPRGSEAEDVYDAIRLLAPIPAFTELRRGDKRPLDRR